MTQRLNSRILGDVSSSSRDTTQSVDSDFVVILAALLCALICVLGLVAVARCGWIRRLTSTSAALANITTTTTTQPPPANKGLKKKVVNSLPKLIYSAGDQDQDQGGQRQHDHHDGEGGESGKFSVDCCICLAEFVSGDEIRVLPQCGHVFHVGCIDTWLKSHATCPSCRVHILATATSKDHKCRELASGSSSSSSSAASGSRTATTTSGTSSTRDSPNSGCTGKGDEINRFLA